MSEFQYYEFVAVDRRLTKTQEQLADFLALDDDLIEAAAQASRGGAAAGLGTAEG